MNILLDTHILIRALNDDPRLPEKARELILDEVTLFTTVLYPSGRFLSNMPFIPTMCSSQERIFPVSARMPAFCPSRYGTDMYLL